jgi:hypothetical protein
LAAPAPRGTSKVDILVNFLDDRQPVLLQVKARQYGSDGGWHMSEKHETVTDHRIFYCFVNFEPENPTVHVVPAAVVADADARAALRCACLVDRLNPCSDLAVCIFIARPN